MAAMLELLRKAALGIYRPRGFEEEEDLQTLLFLRVKKQPSQDMLHGDEAEEELGLVRLVSSYTLPRQNSQPGGRGRQTRSEERRVGKECLE